MEQKEWLSVIVLIILVSLGINLGLGGLTGKIVKVQTNITGPEVYTKSEIDTNTNLINQWITSGKNIYYKDGNVGIGTSAPRSKLNVVGEIVSGSVTLPSFGFGGSNLSADTLSIGSTYGYAKEVGLLVKAWDKFWITGPVVFRSSSGTGNAYACFSNNGTLFRSSSSCVNTTSSTPNCGNRICETGEIATCPVDCF